MGKRYWRERAHTRASPRVVNNTHVTRPVAVLPCKKGYIVLNDSQLERLLFAPETTIYLCPTYYTYVYNVYGWRPRDDVPFNIIILHTRPYPSTCSAHNIIILYVYRYTDVYNNNRRRWMAATAPWWSFEIRVVGRQKCALVDIVFYRFRL